MQILENHLSKYKLRSFSDLAQLIVSEKNPATFEVKENGIDYIVEITVEWRDKNKTEIRVIGFADEARPRHWWRQFYSKNSLSFVKHEDETITDGP